MRRMDDWCRLATGGFPLWWIVAAAGCAAFWVWMLA